MFVRLNNGLRYPQIGAGTFPLRGYSLLKAMYYAYKNGCVSFDTSPAYGNERWIGIGIKMLKLLGAKRIYVTTKLSNSGQRSGDVRAEFNSSLKRLGVTYIDLYLMHWPNPETYVEAWLEMERIYKEGHVGAIGVCNFHEHHLDKILEVAAVVPAVNQVELHPLLTQNKLREYCSGKGIQVQSYSPVARMDKKLIGNEALLLIANRHHKSVPQIILKWNIQSGLMVIPKSASSFKIKENFSLNDFVLTDVELKAIDSLNANYRVRYDPDNADFSKL